MMAEIFRIRMNNSMVPNFVMKVDHTLQPRPHNIWATKVEFGTSNGSSKFENVLLIIYRFVT